MNVSGARFIHSRGESREIAELLQSIFVGELIAPSQGLYLVSPWISDVGILDNRTHAFLSLEPSWTGSTVRLTEVLSRLMEMGTKITVATRPVAHNARFLEEFRRRAEHAGAAPHVHVAEELHEKGILGDTFYLSGSMNVTYNGISVNEEGIHYHTDAGVVAHNRQVFRERWGGSR